MDTVTARRIPVPRVLDRLAALRAKRAKIDAEETILLARLAADADPYGDGLYEIGKEWIREDVACALHLAPVTAGAKLHTATRLVQRFPATVATMHAGDLPGYYATRLVEATEELSDGAAAKVEERVLPRAAGQTVSQFGAALRRAVHAVDTRSVEDQHVAARDTRRVVFQPPQTDGMVELWALLPADQAAALEARVTALADSWKSLDDGRTSDQRRADALCALGFGDSDVKATINVTVPVSSLLDASDEPGELNGHPVAASIARAVAFDPTSRWRRLLVDDDGRLVDVSSQTYRPPAPMQRFVDLRDVTCQFPGCARKAVYCEQDHVIPWSQGGPTTAGNLICLCRRHHHLKHDAGWTLSRAPDGALVWKSPTGHAYRRPPPEPRPG